MDSILYVWGSDSEGQLGLGKNRSQQFYAIPKICHYKMQFIQVSCGKDHTALLTTAGHVYTMGNNEFNKLGHFRSGQAPSRIESLINVTQVSCGYTHTACITQEGILYTWGDNQYGQLGVKQVNTINKLLGIKNCKQVSCGNQHTLVLIDNGDCFAFGLGENSQLGQQKIKYSFDPLKLKVSFLSQCVAGNLFSIFLTKDGSVYICGQNYGNLQKLNYKVKFTKIGGKSTAIGLTINNELIFFDLDEQLQNIKDFQAGDLMGLAIGDKIYQWQFDQSEKQLSTLKQVEQLNGKNLIDFSVGNSHIICIGYGYSQSFVESSISQTSTLRQKHEERSRSNYADRSDQDISYYIQKIQQLEKMIDEKDKTIQSIKIEYKEKISQLQYQIKEKDSLLLQKDQEIKQLNNEVQQLQEGYINNNNNNIIEYSNSEILQCQVQDDIQNIDEEFNVNMLKKQKSLPFQDIQQLQHQNVHSHISLHKNDNVSFNKQQQIKSPVKTNQIELEDSLQKRKGLKTDYDNEQKYQSYEKIKRKDVLNERPQSFVREKGKNIDEKNNNNNLSTIKLRLTDLQKNKEQLEQRMRQFEDRLRENKLYTK